ncbi:MAG TPA: cytidine deaminase [Thermoanaerobaculia bacterium]|nr:cytidine deaminase [Thermoanaerobaculia bacterium]
MKDRLLSKALEARDRAIAPYSNFKVGSAIQTRDGRIIQGCNIENASFGLTVCAERVALLTALAAGERSFEAVAVATGVREPATPCGPCRQLLWEYCGDIEVILGNPEGVKKTYRLSELLPHPFSHIPEE